MAIYKWLDTNKLVRRSSDGASIPSDAGNTDWQAFLAWAALGNTPDAADPPPPPFDFSSLDNLDKVLKAFALQMRDYTNALQAGTHTQKTLNQFKNDFKNKYDSLP